MKYCVKPQVLTPDECDQYDPGRPNRGEEGGGEQYDGKNIETSQYLGVDLDSNGPTIFF